MNCPIITAKQYQAGFNSGLILVGFEDEAPQWLGTDQQWKSYSKLI